MTAVLVVGGYGTFGVHVCRELAKLGIPVVVAGRDGVQARKLAEQLGPGHRGREVDVKQADSCRSAFQDCRVAINCAGPFQSLGSGLLDACLAARCHYIDIADDRRYATMVRGYAAQYRDAELAAVYGCSSLPGISAALGLIAQHGATTMPERARVTLFIGNDNPKGQAAMQSLLGALGQPIASPQGTLLGFRDREVVELPPPFGSRGVFNFDSPDYDVLPTLLGVRAVSVKVGFELRLATYGIAFLAWLGIPLGPGSAWLLELPSRLLRGIGTSGGAVMTELFYPDGRKRTAAIVAGKNGQRMAALPAVFVARKLLAAPSAFHGVGIAHDVLGAKELIEALVEQGYDFECHPHH
ncbi:MAG: SDR family NAD(P)-dependent oxidoreductase [Planctomycetes bacterium]|nr:SDR family NAD(P)-dependent oxidoreductase [Planctomycetota bacterium]